MRGRFIYVELPAARLAETKAFYAEALGFEWSDFGPSYASTMTGAVDAGLQGDPSEATAAPLPVLLVDDLESAEAAVLAAGGEIVRPIFAFPGGRRFHLRDPSGNELAVMAAQEAG